MKKLVPYLLIFLFFFNPAKVFAQLPREFSGSLFSGRLEEFQANPDGNDVLIFSLRNQTEKTLRIAWLKDTLLVGFCDEFSLSSIPIFAEKFFPEPATLTMQPGVEMMLKLERDDSRCFKEAGLMTLLGDLFIYEGDKLPLVRHIGLSMKIP